MQNLAATLPTLSSTSPFNLTSTQSNGNPSPKRRHRLSLTAASASVSTNLNLRETREEAARSAKREIRANLREDWKWPPTAPSTPSNKKTNLRIEPTTQWRERDADSSASPSPSSPASNPYKYDSPDSVASAMFTRKRKRRRLLLSEMSWNPGLNTFIRRRDAWTGGVTLPLPTSLEPNISDPAFPEQPVATFVPPPKYHGYEPLDLLPTVPSSHPQPSPTDDILELTPLPPSLLPPTHPIRTSITPETYPSIYKRVILEGVTPSVPINLADVTRALVCGWKDEGEWPPKQTAVGMLDPLVGRRRTKKMNKDKDKDGSNGIKSGKRNNKDGGGPGNGEIHGLITLDGDADAGEKVAGLGLAKRGVGRMKKVLGGLRGEGGEGFAGRGWTASGRERANSSPIPLSKDG